MEEQLWHYSQIFIPTSPITSILPQESVCLLVKAEALLLLNTVQVGLREVVALPQTVVCCDWMRLENMHQMSSDGTASPLPLGFILLAPPLQPPLPQPMQPGSPMGPIGPPIGPPMGPIEPIWPPMPFIGPPMGPPIGLPMLIVPMPIPLPAPSFSGAGSRSFACNFPFRSTAMKATYSPSLNSPLCFWWRNTLAERVGTRSVCSSAAATKTTKRSLST